MNQVPGFIVDIPVFLRCHLETEYELRFRKATASKTRPISERIHAPVKTIQIPYLIGDDIRLKERVVLGQSGVLSSANDDVISTRILPLDKHWKLTRIFNANSIDTGKTIGCAEKCF